MKNSMSLHWLIFMSCLSFMLSSCPKSGKLVMGITDSQKQLDLDAQDRERKQESHQLDSLEVEDKTEILEVLEKEEQKQFDDVEGLALYDVEAEHGDTIMQEVPETDAEHKDTEAQTEWLDLVPLPDITEISPHEGVVPDLVESETDNLLADQVQAVDVNEQFEQELEIQQSYPDSYEINYPDEASSYPDLTDTQEEITQLEYESGEIDTWGDGYDVYMDSSDAQPTDGLADLSDAQFADQLPDGPTIADLTEVGDLVQQECENKSGDGDLILLIGAILSHNLYLESGQVLVNTQTGKIECVAEFCGEIDENTTIVCTNGIITPGLIDAHNHVQYNILPRWKHSIKFNNRYQWQATTSYKKFKKPYTMLFNSFACEMTKWGEIRALIAGTTSITGSPGGKDCINVLIRNTEEGPDSNGLPGEYGIKYYVPKFSNLDDSDIFSILQQLDTGALEVFEPHLAEGIDQASRAEFDLLEDAGLLIDKTTIIHGTAGTTVELSKMAAQGTKLVWSPQSNIDLYGETASVTTALNLGVLVALAPDWTPSGTMNLLYEIKCAQYLNKTYYNSALSHEMLFDMVTINAARALHLEDKIGLLQPGYYADIAVFDADVTKPYESFAQAGPEDVNLVMVGGKPLYGSVEIMNLFADENCELLDVCGHPKTICVADPSSPWPLSGQTLADIETTLVDALAQAEEQYIASGNLDPDDPLGTYNFQLMPLFICEDQVHWCEMGNKYVSGVPTENDADGDDVSDPEDVCPLVFDPDQSDLDGDELGDACDPCPMIPYAQECDKPNPADLDSDGLENEQDNCPTHYNPEQEDQDNDGKGDLCDPCPEFYNPEDMGCPYTVYELCDENHPNHPDEGTYVLLQEVVITAIFEKPYAATGGMYVQELDGGPFSGIFLYFGSTPVPDVSLGQVVSASGQYFEYFSKAELQWPAVEVVQAEPIALEPIVVPAEQLCTGNPTAESYEGVFVEVNNVVVTNANPDAPKDYDEFVVAGCLRIDDFIYQDMIKPPEGTEFEFIRGILNYSYQNYKLCPRGPQDYLLKE